ncbi:MAG: DUF2796 domain-containing protein [Parvularculaceae bacterium]|nr:DUF2796 domain-containing protein [Parvularculaceae bacterium]
MNKSFGLAFAASISALAASAVAQHHEHGKGQLTLSTEGNMLVAEFMTDQHTAFGFEGKPKDANQNASMAKGEALMTATGNLFTVATGSTCERVEVTVDVMGPQGGLGSLDSSHDDHDDHDDHHDHEHEEHHGDHSDHHDHDAHDDHDEHAEHEDEAEHQDVMVRQVFRCSSNPAIESVSVGAFEHFASLETVVVTALTEKEQTQATLNRGRKQWRLK